MDKKVSIFMLFLSSAKSWMRALKADMEAVKQEMIRFKADMKVVKQKMICFKADIKAYEESAIYFRSCSKSIEEKIKQDLDVSIQNKNKTYSMKKYEGGRIA